MVHHFGAVSAEEDNRRGQVGLEAHLFAEGHWIDLFLDVKIRAQNHPRCLKNMGVIVAEGTRLLDRAVGAGNDVLLFNRLDPEARRVVSQVRDEGHKRPAGIDGVPAFPDFAVEVGDNGNEQVGGMGAPELFEQADHGPVEDANCKLKDLQELRAAEGPAVLQHDVVLLLDTDAGELAKNVQLIGQVLELNEFYIPWAPLLLHNRLKGDGCIAMSAAGIMEDHVDFFHGYDCAIRLMFAAKSNQHAMWITQEVQCVQAVP